MFNKKKKKGASLIKLSSNVKEHKPKDVLTVNREPKGQHNNTVKRTISSMESDYLDTSEFENNPLLTSSNNIKFYNKLLTTNTEALKLDRGLSAEDKTVVQMLSQLHDYLPPTKEFDFSNDNPFVTLTYAQSLDSKIGFKFKKTPISHIETKQVTQFLRYHHDCIVVGFNTFREDNPNLNFKYYDATMRFFIKDLKHHIVPLILDPNLRIVDYIADSDENSINLKKNYESGLGAKPVFICLESIYDKKVVNSCKWFDVLFVPDDLYYDPSKIFKDIYRQNRSYKRFMVEGGALIINALLKQEYQEPFIDSTIVTVAPIYLGHNAVEVTPRIGDKMSLNNVSWVKGSSDVVLLSKK